MSLHALRVAGHGLEAGSPCYGEKIPPGFGEQNPLDVRIRCRSPRDVCAGFGRSTGGELFDK
jgi:hypothetical protein